MILDMMFFAKYQPSAGFKFSLAGVHNVPKKIAYIGTCCLNQKNALYGEENEIDPTKAHLFSILDWDRY